MLPTTISSFDGKESMILNENPTAGGPADLMERYGAVLEESRFSWINSHRMVRRIGSGGQGVVYLCERLGSDQFTLPVAVKVFSPERYEDAPAYDYGMAHMARVAVRVAQIQQDNLIDVHNFVEFNRIRLMEMEFIDGYDLYHLLTPAMLKRCRELVQDERWDYLNNVIVTAGPAQPRLKPGVAIAVLRDCLAALSALHREGIIHGDVKPSNIMLKRTGNAKLVDIGAAFEMQQGPRMRTFTPTYAAPEVLEGTDGSSQSDLASLGYVLVELLAGKPLFPDLRKRDEFLIAKTTFSDRLHEILPDDVLCNDLLMSLIRGLVAADPRDRFPSAEAADLVEQGAASFHRQLVKSNLSSEYDNEIRVWLGELE
ncbi:serine/threonine-protein kinase [Singulisphaera sp. PoT]|uniref:serine/threonine-protein kinase n=1 Tax=Singulisphaera sp. PoT TaxID=3411797 RepID=UPI003BF47878